MVQKVATSSPTSAFKGLSNPQIQKWDRENTCNGHNDRFWKSLLAATKTLTLGVRVGRLCPENSYNFPIPVF